MAPDAQTLLPVVICPGFHNESLTDGFVRSLPDFAKPYIIKHISPTDPFAIYQWLTQTFAAPRLSGSPLVGIGYSAGVVGLTGALLMWQQQGHHVAKFIAVDGWGVPIIGLPMSRISHDRFTHMTCLPLGAGEVNFYADPAVTHEQLWSAPEVARGWQMNGWSSDQGTQTTAANFLKSVLQQTRREAFDWRATV